VCVIISLLACRSLPIQLMHYWNRPVTYPICQSVCLCVWKVYCDKMSEWIWMLFGVVNRVSRGMGVIDGGDDH